MNRRQKINLIKSIVKGHTSISELQNPDYLFLIIWKYNDVPGYYCWNYSQEWTEEEFRSYLKKYSTAQFYLMHTSREKPLYNKMPKNQHR